MTVSMQSRCCGQWELSYVASCMQEWIMYYCEVWYWLKHVLYSGDFIGHLLRKMWTGSQKLIMIHFN